MTRRTVIGGVDFVGTADLKELVESRQGPCVSVFMPTHRSGPDTQQDPVRLKGLVERASEQLESWGFDRDEARKFLAPCRKLVKDGQFWKYPADGLALYCAPSYFRRFWVQVPLEEKVDVDRAFHVRPLLPLLTGDSRFYILSIAQNEVKLYEGTRTSVAELRLGPIPANMEEVMANEEFQRQLQFRSVSRNAVQFFGNGAGGEFDKESVEEFLRAIDRGVVKVLGEDNHPLVLAAVGYYAPLYRAMSHYPNVIDLSVEGNPEHQGPAELHQRAWKLVKPILEADRLQAIERVREISTEHVVSLIADVVTSAIEGAVDSLLVAPGPPIWGKIDPATGVVEELEEPLIGSEDLLERSVAETLTNDGKIYSVGAEELPQTRVAALLRF